MTELKHGKYYYSLKTENRYICFGEGLYMMGEFGLEWPRSLQIHNQEEIEGMMLVDCDIDGEYNSSQYTTPISALEEGDRFWISSDGYINDDEEPLVKCKWAGPDLGQVPCYNPNTESVELLSSGILVYPE